MRKNTPFLVGLAAALVASAAFASHATDPIALTQDFNGSSLSVGSVIPTTAAGTGTVTLGATHDSVTNGSCCGPYTLEIEVQPLNVAFTGTPNHSSAQLGSSTTSSVPFPPTNITLAPGTYHWQVRELGSSSPLYSNWVPFNGGNAAFTVAPPGVPDLVVSNVNMTNTVLDTSVTPNTLSFNVVGDFENRGDTTTAGFTWKAYLSTDKQLDYGTDTLIYTSTTPITVPGYGTTQDTSPTIMLNPRPPPGQYYILIEADPAPTGCTTNCGTVSEFDETNNVGSTQNYFTNGFDLVAVSISNGPVNASPGDSVTLNVSFFNQGIEEPKSNPVEFLITISRASTPATSDYPAYRGSVTLSGGTSFNAPVTFVLPPDVAGGDIKWGLIIDPPKPGLQNPNVEANENNNSAITSGMTHIQQADLEPTSADLVDFYTRQPTRVADMGYPARFLVNVTNTGDFAAPPTKACVVISRNNTFSLLEDWYIGEASVTALAAPPATNTTQWDLEVTMPSVDNKGKALTTGDYYFFVTLDCDNDINEIHEDNKMAVDGPVRLRTPAADYAALKVYGPAKAAGGETIPLQRTIKNVGTQDGPATDYRCFASANPIISTQDFPLEFVKEDNTTEPSRSVQLEKGKSDVATDLVRIPGAIPGANYYIGCVVDPDNKIPELDESNNWTITTTPMQISAQSFQIVTRQLPDATLQTPYSFKLSTTGAVGAVTWSWSGEKAPEGMSLTSDGIIQDPPKTAGVFSFKVQATNGNRTAESVLVMRVLPPTTELVITTDNLPSVTNDSGIPYQAAFSASGGAKPYLWTILSGALPNGIALDSMSGLLSGKPRPGLPVGETRLTVQVRDSLGNSAVKDLKISVVAPGALSVKTLALPDSLVNADYLTDLAAEVAGGGAVQKPLVWTVVSGHLPEGLVLETHTDQATGIISGKPTVAGTYPVTIQVQDANARSDTADYIIRIYASALKVAFAAAPPAEIHPGDALDLQVTATGGTGVATYRLYSGALPAGLTLDEDGKLAGKIKDDAAAGSYSFVVEATDVSGGKGMGAFNLEVTPKPKAQGCSSTGSAPFGGSLVIALGLLALIARRRSQHS